MDDSAISEEGELPHVKDDEVEVNISNIVSNNFAALNSAKDSALLEEGELYHSATQDDIPVASSGPMDLSGADCLDLPIVGEHKNQNSPSPKVNHSSPSYVEVIMKKPLDSPGSSNHDSIEKLSKNAGRKSRKEAREEEDERLKM